MDTSKVSIANKILTLTASLSRGEKPASSGGKSIPVKYRSSTVHEKEKSNVSQTGGYDFVADFKATTTKGTWPAFWLTAVDGWPPEVDLAEWKGSGKISFNPLKTSSQMAAKDVSYPNTGDWHTFRTKLRHLNGNDSVAKFHLDGKPVTTQTGRGFVGKLVWL